MKSSLSRRLSLLSMIVLLTMCFSMPAYSDNLLLYAGGGATRFDGQGAATLSAAAGTNLLPWLEGGITLTAFHTLERSYKDEYGKTFQAESGFAAFYLRPHFSAGEKVEIGFPIQSGSGTLLFRYEHKYRKELVWTDEVLDQVQYGLFSAGMDITFLLCSSHRLTLAGSYRSTSPLRTPFMDDGSLDGFAAEIRYGWKFF